MAAAVVASMAAVAAEAVSTVAVVEAVSAVEAVSTVAVVAVSMAGVMVARGLMVEEVTSEAVAFVVDQRRVVAERAAVRTAGLELAATTQEIIRRILVPQSPMASGIRSATPAATPLVPRVPVEDAIPEARQEARPMSPAEPPDRRRISVGVVMVREAEGVTTVGAVVGVGATVGAGEVGAGVGVVAAGAGAGEVGALALDGRTGAPTGGPAGILTGIPRWLTPTRITPMTGTTIRRTVRMHRRMSRRIRHRMRCITTTRRQVT